VGHLIFLGIGANLGDRERNLREGLRLLAPEVGILKVSDLYETEPVGVRDQPAFLNAACEAATELGPEALLEYVKRVERMAGRVPGARWGPRALDIDVLLYDDAIVDLPDLHIPHARLAERAFVLRPLTDLAPSLVVPGLDASIALLLQSVDQTGVKRLTDSSWNPLDAEPL
jgi:2-amino-4-hydroxy-6-hydroxymethyldihydropteridine diphosphokinase